MRRRDRRGARAFIELIAAEPRLSATVIQTVGKKGYDGFSHCPRRCISPKIIAAGTRNELASFGRKMKIRTAGIPEIHGLVSLSGHVLSLHAAAMPSLFRSRPPAAEVAEAFLDARRSEYGLAGRRRGCPVRSPACAVPRPAGELVSPRIAVLHYQPHCRSSPGAEKGCRPPVDRRVSRRGGKAGVSSH